MVHRACSASRRGVLLAAAAFLSAFLVPPAEASAGRAHPRLSPGLLRQAQQLHGDQMVDVVVSFTSMPGSSAHALAASLGGTGKHSYRKLPFRALRVPVRRLEALAARGDVRLVSEDEEVTGASVAARQTARVPGSGATGLTTTNTGYDGSAVTVAVVDSGVSAHGDYYNTLLGQFNFVGGAAGTAMSQSDGYGHGTHVAGLIGADGYFSTTYQYQGASTRAKVVSLRVLDDTGMGSLSDTLAALDWILDVGKPQYGIRVANLSLGKAVTGSAATDPLVQAVEAVWDAGIVVVVSAGNFGLFGHYTVSSPGISRKVITVGSLTDNGTGTNFADDYPSTFSSRGPTLHDKALKPDLLAPGNLVVSTFAPASLLGTLLPTRVICGTTAPTCTHRYLKLSGTSMAAPIVTAAVARMLHKSPSLSPATVKARLMKSARKVTGDPTIVGAGVLDTEAAMNATGTATQALSPLLGRSADGTRVYVQDTATLWGGSQWAAAYIWSSGSGWSSSYTSGGGYLWSDASLWSDGYLWSDASLWSNSFLWSDGYLWSNGFLWSDTILGFSAETADPEVPQP